ncbi:hypothetical protein FGKAn22_08020 [Ferrigenium kumadai]|uniref:Uncharacterized protein n=1 Tax=Ferrigenium kumadai TaxID=1682490 RepID=A0AAN1VZ87_9PROT|nr:hypothetical protein FGKAn22_08020 [Ferrigenium kumadai]
MDLAGDEGCHASQHQRPVEETDEQVPDLHGPALIDAISIDLLHVTPKQLTDKRRTRVRFDTSKLRTNALPTMAKNFGSIGKNFF